MHSNERSTASHSDSVELRGPSQFSTQFYVLDLPSAAAASTLEIVFETAASHFCAVSNLQLWGT
jgi:hypothetical protein